MIVCDSMIYAYFSFTSSKEDLLSLKVLLVQLKETRIQLESKDAVTLVTKTALQFLGNVCVMNTGRQALVWEMYFSEVFM